MGCGRASGLVVNPRDSSASKSQEKDGEFLGIVQDNTDSLSHLTPTHDRGSQGLRCTLQGARKHFPVLSQVRLREI
jgi:hypothetical protein